MTPDLVVDVGNSRMKWGLCESDRVAKKESLPLEDASGWEAIFQQWNLRGTETWALAGVNPVRQNAFLEWLRTRSSQVRVIQHHNFQGLQVDLDNPTQVGIDRLLTALAARRSVDVNIPVILINIGTATTIDLVERETFRGGAIMPGPALMARSLNQHTAALPLASVEARLPAGTWGRNTDAAIRTGIAAAVLGSADFLIWEWSKRLPVSPWICITGGDAGYVVGFDFTAEVAGVTHAPLLTLEGIRLASAPLPSIM